MADTPTPPSWAEVPRTTVRWSLARVDGDTTDVAVGDKVTLQPAPGGIAVVDPLDPYPVSIVLEPRTYKVRGDGALVDDQGDMAAVLAVDDPRVATPGGRSVQWIARHERGNGVIRFPAVDGETVELSRWVAATAPETTQRSWAEQLVDAAEDVTAGLAAAVGAGDAAVAAAGQAAGFAGSAAGSASAAATSATAASQSAATATSAATAASSDADDASEARTGAIAARDGAVAARTGAETARTEAEALVSDASLDTAVAEYLTANPPPAGPPNVLTKGTVTTGAPGTEADFSITGTAPEQVLSLTIPRGEPGEGGSALSRPHVSGLYHMGLNGPLTATVESTAWSATRLVAYLVLIDADVTIDRLMTHITTAAAGATLRIGLYADDGGKPGALALTHAGTLDCSTTGSKEAIVGATPIAAGWYWAVHQGGGGTIKSRVPSSTATWWPLGSEASLAQDSICLKATRADAALPASLEGTAWTTGVDIPHLIRYRTA